MVAGAPVAEGEGTVEAEGDSEVGANLLLGVMGVAKEAAADLATRSEPGRKVGTGDRMADESLNLKITPVFSGSFEGCTRERLTVVGVGSSPLPPPPLFAISPAQPTMPNRKSKSFFLN